MTRINLNAKCGRCKQDWEHRQIEGYIYNSREEKNYPFRRYLCDVHYNTFFDTEIADAEYSKITLEIDSFYDMPILLEELSKLDNLKQ